MWSRAAASSWALLVLVLGVVLTSACAQLIGAPFDKEFVVDPGETDGGRVPSGVAASCLSRGAECGAFEDEALLVTFQCGGCASNESCLTNQCICDTATCEELGAECGYQNNGCNQLTNCGRCEDLYPGDPNKAYCDADGKCGRAPVLPTTCQEARDLGHPADCGTVGIGETTLDCGTCPGREQCINNSCEGYVPLTCEELTGGGLLCGTFPNGAGAEITCACAPGERCAEGNICCSPRTECGTDACGTISDGCGGSIECGGCGDGKTCLDNVCCGETPQCPSGVCGPQVVVCGQILDCGCADGQCCVGDEGGMGTCHAPSCPSDGRCGDGLPDGCGGVVDDCGCPTAHECNAENQCECVPRDCPTDGTCGLVDDGCGGEIECFVCPGGQLCSEGACCEPSCPADGACGLVSNGCGGQIMCGCGEGESCVDQLCVTPECSEGAGCGVNLVNGIALSCRGPCEDGQVCAERADGIYACGDCSATCPDDAQCGLTDVGCTTLSCAGECGLAQQHCVNRRTGDGPDNFSCCTPACPNVEEATCGENVDPFCGGNVANCPGACGNGQRCVSSEDGYKCVTPECPANPVCGENAAVPEGTIQCNGSCSGAREQCIQTGSRFECACQAIVDPCGVSCDTTVDDGCGRPTPCTCPALEECVEGACCKPDSARAICEAAGAECNSVEDPKCGTQADCGVCTGDQTCDDNRCVCDPARCEAHESCNASTRTCTCDNSKCPAGQACTNAGVCSCDSAQCPNGKTCNGQGVCACPQTNAQACNGRTCGTATNSCGDTVNCGNCPSGRTCSSGQCVCSESNAAACVGVACGTTQNDCGENVTCPSSCDANETCSGNQCVCSQTLTQACATVACGETTNSCGDTVSCPSTCTPQETCSGNECVCTETQPQACTRLNLECGAPPGGSLNTCLEPLPSTSCGTCAATETCQTNKCVCTETPAQACTRLQLECGAPPSTATNNCGEQLPANTSCGTCGAPETCQDNECVVPCTETACTGRECGMVQSSCSNVMISCGACTAPETCQNNICDAPCTETACTGLECGTVQSSCSNATISCGTCEATETCQNNECVVACTETACTGLECGTVQSSCSSVMISCGTCTAPETCQNSICADPPCTETACAGRVCGTVQSSCSNDMISCGPCNGTCSQDGGTCTPPPISDSGP